MEPTSGDGRKPQGIEMKRGVPLSRGKPLRRGQPLKRSKPLKRKTRLRRRMPLLRKDDGHDWPAMGEALWRRTVETGKPGICEKCGKGRIRKMEIRKANIHHIKPRGKGGSDDPSNLGFVCSSYQFMGREDFSCHTWIKNNPKEARAEGWLK